jgi:nucleotide-binding universal stress UspA family protein
MADSGVIIFPTDFSETSRGALQWAKRMASILGAELHCLYVVEEPHIYSTLDLGPLPVPTTDELSGSAQVQLNAFVEEHLHGLDQSVSVHVAVGRPADEIMEYAKLKNATMIVMATNGYSGVKHLALGSTTEAVVRQAECPVFSVRASE